MQRGGQVESKIDTSTRRKCFYWDMISMKSDIPAKQFFFVENITMVPSKIVGKGEKEKKL